MMTRLAFLWKVLAFGWVGQQAARKWKPLPVDSQEPAVHGVVQQATGWETVTSPVSTVALDGKPTKSICDVSESRCPIGHCQKPVYIAMNTRFIGDNPMKIPDDRPPSEYNYIYQRICVVCGIVYMPVARGLTNEISE